MSDTPLTLESLETQAIELTTEAFKFRGAIDSIGEKLKLFGNNFKQFIEERFVSQDVTLNLMDEKKLKNYERSVKYTDVRQDMIRIPRGLKVSFLDHLHTLNQSQDVVDKLIPETLTPCEKYLGTVLSSPDTLKSQRDAGIFDVIVLHDIDKIRALVAKDFDKDQAEYRRYGQMIKSQSTLGTLAKSYNDLAVRFSRVPRDEILEYVAQIVDHMDTIIVNLKEDPEVYSGTGASIANLAKVAQAVATEVEYYSIHAFMLEQMDACMSELG